MSNLFLFSPGVPEIVLILVVVLLLFGGRKIPELMRGLGKGIREFNTARENIKAEIEEGIKEGDKKSATTQEETKQSNTAG